MADSIKGKDYEKYSGNLRKGILLHRKIDSFTDCHPIVQQSSHRLFKKYRHYNGVIIDVFYDHFLAKNWQEFHTQDLETYVQDFYALLAEYKEKVPENIQRMYPYMKLQNWLYSYRKVSGIKQILYQMNSRVKGDFNIHQSVSDLKKNYGKYEKEFYAFFPEIQDYVAQVKRELGVSSER